MLISSKSVGKLADSISSSPETYCSGLFLSARWFVLAESVHGGVHLVVLPDKESAEYCTSDLYNLVDGDCVFFLPDSGKKIERSNYKSSLSVQRTSSISEIVEKKDDSLLIIVTYPEALMEKIPSMDRLDSPLMTFVEGEETDYDSIGEKLASAGFEKVDFVSEPGQYALRGGIVDIFSYSFNNPFRISFFGNEVESIHVFNCNTQLSENKVGKAEIYPDLSCREENEDGMYVTGILPENTTVWLDSSDMYSRD